MNNFTKVFVLLALVVLFNNQVVTGKKFKSECAIAKELLKHGFPKDQLNDWVCLVMSESSGNTRAINKANADGSIDHGLFQINDRYWCEHGKKGKECNVNCKGAVFFNTPCIVHNRTFFHGETFLLDCRTQCVCQNGKYECSSVCPEKALTSQCDHPQLLEMPGYCCRQWLCDSKRKQEYKNHQHHHYHHWELQHYKQLHRQLSDIQVNNLSTTTKTLKDNNSNSNTTYFNTLSTNNFNKTYNTPSSTSYNTTATSRSLKLRSNVLQKSQEDMKYSQWSSCTMSCGTGLSQRQLNTEYETITETRVCQDRMCTIITQTEDTNNDTRSSYTIDRSSNVTYQSFNNHSTFYHQQHHRRKGHDCRATQHMQTPVYYQIGLCQSTKVYRPKYCGQCEPQSYRNNNNNNNNSKQQQICCKPLLTSTINIKFICDSTREDTTFETDMDLVYDNLQLGMNLWNQTTITQQNHNNNISNLTRVIHVNVQWILKCICRKCDSDDYDELYNDKNHVNMHEFITRAPKTEVILHRVHRTAPP